MSEATALATLATSLPIFFSIEPRTDDEDEDGLSLTKFWPRNEVLSWIAYEYLMIIQKRWMWGSLQLKGLHLPETQPLNQQRGRAERE